MKQNKINVLIITRSLDTGGISSFIITALKNISNPNIFNVSFLLEKKSEHFYADIIKYLDIKIFYYLDIKLKLFRHIYNLICCFTKSHPKVIHVHNGYFSGLIVFIAFIFGIKKRIVHSHFSEDLKKQTLIRKVYIFFSILLINLFSTKKLACSDLAGKFLFKQNYIVINNGIDIEKFKFNQEARNKIRKELNIENKIVIGHVGRFTTPKNYPFLINIFNEFYKYNELSVLILIGDGVLKKDIEQMVNKLNLNNNVIFTGAKNNIYDYYQMMDCFVFPSFSEGLGLVSIEAQCSGLPCFVSDDIPDEAIICNTTKISLSKPAKEWANIILEKTKNFKRKDCSDLIKQADFDIKDTAEQIKRIYLEE